MKALNTVKQKGQVAIMMGIAIIILIGAVGIAIDSGLGYIIKAKLNAAVDAAGIAAARSVTLGNTQDEQRTNARVAARKFFNANYPNDGYLGSIPTLNDADIVIEFDQGKTTITISARSIVHVRFMQLFGFNWLTVNATSTTVRKDLDLSFVIDTSGSMSSVAGKVRSAAQSFLDYFNPLTDRMSLTHFSYGAVVDDAFRPVARGFDRTTMKTHIQNYNFSGLTNSSEGFWNARNQLNTVIDSNKRSSMRVIVFFSDGSPNTFASRFTFRVASECSTPGSLISNDSQTGTPQGLWRFDRQDVQAAGNCYQGSNITSHLTTTAFPNCYNAHNTTIPDNAANCTSYDSFPVVTNSPRQVLDSTNNTSNTYRYVNRASRNLLESMADRARSEGIYVFTLGLGAQLQTGTGPDNERGEDLLKCIANTPDAIQRCRTAGASQPKGVYCYAATADDLKPCFSRLASEILRITK